MGEIVSLIMHNAISYRLQHNWGFRSAHSVFISSIFNPITTYRQCQASNSNTSPSIIPREMGVAPFFLTAFSTNFSAFNAPAGFETKDHDATKMAQFDKKLVSINTYGVPLFSRFPICSPTRKGDGMLEFSRCWMRMLLQTAPV